MFVDNNVKCKHISFDNYVLTICKWRILMDKTVKLLIIIVVALVAVLGVAGGFILQGYMSNSNKNVTVNQTNASVNNNTTVQTTKSTSKPSQIQSISSSQAISIANQYAAALVRRLMVRRIPKWHWYVQHG